jgi:hypothetical protein
MTGEREIRVQNLLRQDPGAHARDAERGRVNAPEKRCKNTGSKGEIGADNLDFLFYSRLYSIAKEMLANERRPRSQVRRDGL